MSTDVYFIQKLFRMENPQANLPRYYCNTYTDWLERKLADALNAMEQAKPAHVPESEPNTTGGAIPHN
jgi:hypothetical protein